ncbi:MAG: DUF1761 domain-containing protein [archaeon]|nr:DUF1761 domain-containing protein [archaeon]
MVSFDVNLIGVAAAGIGAFILGFLWYGPLFGKRWMALTGKTMKDMESSKGNMPLYMLGGLVSALVTSYVLGVFLVSLGALAMGDALFVAFLAWLGFQAMLLVGDILWEAKPVALFVLNAAYQLVALLLMATIITII